MNVFVSFIIDIFCALIELKAEKGIAEQESESLKQVRRLFGLEPILFSKRLPRNTLAACS